MGNLARDQVSTGLQHDWKRERCYCADCIAHGRIGSPGENLHIGDMLHGRQPFSNLSASEIADRMRRFGMHSPAQESRVGCDAFEIRHDVGLGDACETLAERLRQVMGILDFLACAGGLQEIHRSAVMACCTLSQEAGAVLSVIMEAVYPVPPGDACAKLE
jgi:hypothetical protein